MEFRTPYANDILDYLKEHPNARDTLDGILEWWIMERMVQIHKPKVRESVEELVALGVLEERKTRGGMIYKLLGTAGRENGGEGDS